MFENRLTKFGFKDDWREHRGSNAGDTAPADGGEPSENSSGNPSGSDVQPLQNFMDRQHRNANLKKSALDDDIVAEVEQLIEYQVEQFDSDIVPQN